MYIFHLLGYMAGRKLTLKCIAYGWGGLTYAALKLEAVLYILCAFES